MNQQSIQVFMIKNTWVQKKKFTQNMIDFQGKFDIDEDDDDDENDENNQENPEEPVEEPLPSSENKPFNMKKFRESLRKGDCIMGKRNFFRTYLMYNLILNKVILFLLLRCRHSSISTKSC